jgi:hypothetical protein
MSLTSVFNDVINQTNQTKTFGSGLNQKRFSGKVSTAAVKMGSTKGRGSTTRMYNYCTQTSETPSECINEFIAQAPPPIPDILFNISTFNNFNIPPVYKTALLNAASRWNKFIKFNTETVNFIRASSTIDRTFKNWNGIELTGFELNTTGDYRAEAETTYIGASSLNVSFTLKINTTQLSSSLPQNYINDAITHELGHSLGFNNQIVRVNGEPNGAELLPKLVSLITFKKNATIDGQHPLGLVNTYFPKAIEGYNFYYRATREWVNRYSKAIETATTMPINQQLEAGMHISEKAFYSEELSDPANPNSPSKYIKLGFSNEIMTINTWSNTSMRHWISFVSIGFLLGLYSNDRGKNYYNYTQKDEGCEALYSTYFSPPGTVITLYDKPIPFPPR